MADSKELTEAKISLGINPAVLFYSNLLASLNCIETTEIQNADVDGTTLRINPEWFGKLNVQERVGLLAHEASHVIYDHCTTLQMYGSVKKANYAADYYINNELLDAGVTLPSEGLIDSKYRGWSISDIYDDLPDVPEEDYDESLIDVRSYDPDKEAEKHFDVINAVKTAIESTKSQGGFVPNNAQRLVDECMNPPIDWYSLLIKHVSDLADNDITWDNPMYDFLPEFILPDVGGLKVAETIFAVDSSGSVLDHEYGTFLSAIQDCRDIVPAQQTRILDFTTQVNREWLLDEGESATEVEFRSDGGTWIQCIFQHIEEEGITPKFLVVFSDLECMPLTEDPGYPIIWICVNNPDAEVHFGELVHYSTN